MDMCNKNKTHAHKSPDGVVLVGDALGEHVEEPDPVAPVHEQLHGVQLGSDAGEDHLDVEVDSGELRVDVDLGAGRLCHDCEHGDAVDDAVH